MFQAGAEGYVLKTASSDELLAAIRGTQVRPAGESIPERRKAADALPISLAD